MSIEVYRSADRYITVSGVQIGEVQQLADIDAQADAVASRLDGARQTDAGSATKSGRHDLNSLIRDGCGNDFGGDRSRAVWYVMNQLLKQGRSVDEIVGVLLDRGNGISAHVYDQRHPEAYARRQAEKAQKEGGEGADVDAEIKRLAKLSTVDYERERKSASEQLGIRAAILDRLVQAARPDDDDGKQGRAISSRARVVARAGRRRGAAGFGSGSCSEIRGAGGSLTRCGGVMGSALLFDRSLSGVAAARHQFPGKAVRKNDIARRVGADGTATAADGRRHAVGGLSCGRGVSPSASC